MPALMVAVLALALCGAFAVVAAKAVRQTEQDRTRLIAANAALMEAKAIIEDQKRIIDALVAQRETERALFADALSTRFMIASRREETRH